MEVRPWCLWYQENEPTAKTQWGTRNIWVRRMVNIDRDLTGIPVYLEFSNDDDAVFYINGVKIHGTGTTCNKNKVVKLPDEALAVLKQGDNIIAAECINPVGNGLLDFGLQIPKHWKLCLAIQPCRPLPTCSPCRHTTLLPVVVST